MGKNTEFDETQKVNCAREAADREADDAKKAGNAAKHSEEMNECCSGQQGCDCRNEAPENGQEGTSGEDEAARLREQMEEKARQCDEYFNKLQRVAAEFDNYKKRTAREKDALYSEAVSDVVAAFLPVADSIGRAVQACSQEYDKNSLKEGIELVRKQIDDVMKNLGVEEIKSVGEKFDPAFHNAVMHIEDESCDANVIVEEFQKGYKFKDKVIRYSMVKVAN